MSNHPSQQRETEQAGGQTVTSVSDAVFGTRQHTTGAKLQLPRKVPLRIEPKTYFGMLSAAEGLLTGVGGWL